jgi:protein-tyrosine phosphatase/arsenate reductase
VDAVKLLPMLYPTIQSNCDLLIKEFDLITADRKVLLVKISDYIQQKLDSGLPVNLMYVCTHNSRRSHFGQIWAAVAANYFKIINLHTFSAGTEATAFHPNAIAALREHGFIVVKENAANNPVYSVKFGSPTDYVSCFSKTVYDPANPQSEFAAIMTCSDADENCPFIPGVELRIGTTYEDPKAFDGTNLQNEKYLERSLQIGRECLYVFSNLKVKN